MTVKLLQMATNAMQDELLHKLPRGIENKMYRYNNTLLVIDYQILSNKHTPIFTYP